MTLDLILSILDDIAIDCQVDLFPLILIAAWILRFSILYMQAIDMYMEAKNRTKMNFHANSRESTFFSYFFKKKKNYKMATSILMYQNMAINEYFLGAAGGHRILIGTLQNDNLISQQNDQTRILPSSCIWKA